MVRARGENPFANDVDEASRTLVGELRRRAEVARAQQGGQRTDRYDAEQLSNLVGHEVFHVAGRLINRRGFGKMVFLRLRDESGEIQLFVKEEDAKEQFARLDELDIADHIEALGPLMVTKTGELSSPKLPVLYQTSGTVWQTLNSAIVAVMSISLPIPTSQWRFGLGPSSSRLCVPSSTAETSSRSRPPPYIRWWAAPPHIPSRRITTRWT
jgi:hypothetical protein